MSPFRYPVFLADLIDYDMRRSTLIQRIALCVLITAVTLAATTTNRVITIWFPNLCGGVSVGGGALGIYFPYRRATRPYLPAKCTVQEIPPSFLLWPHFSRQSSFELAGWLLFPLWSIIATCIAIIAITHQFRIRASQRAISINQCPKCGYCVIGLQSGRCPECGSAIATG